MSFWTAYVGINGGSAVATSPEGPHEEVLGASLVNKSVDGLSRVTRSVTGTSYVNISVTGSSKVDLVE